MTLVPRIAFAMALAFCAVASFAPEGSAAEVPAVSATGGSPMTSCRRSMCLASLSILSGVWKGTVIMAGGSEMCVSMVVKEVFPDGRVILAMTWNVSIGGREDINNFVGMGEAPNWPNKVENGELRIDSGTKWNGTHYYYVMKLPTAANPDVMEGSWMTENHPQPVVLHRNRGR